METLEQPVLVDRREEAGRPVRLEKLVQLVNPETTELQVNNHYMGAKFIQKCF